MKVKKQNNISNAEKQYLTEHRKLYYWILKQSTPSFYKSAFVLEVDILGMAKRIERVNKLLKEQINNILLREIDFEGVLATITDVETTPDLRYCNMKISVMPENKEKIILKKIENQIYSIQKTLNKKLNMRPVPKIKFKIDQDVKKLYKIDEILNRAEE